LANISIRSEVGRSYYLVAACLSLLLFVGLHFQGIPIIPECGDGWAYWQGAISISTGSGYRDFSGSPILFWPPAYSAYLAAWTVLFGSTAIAMVLGNALLVIVQTLLWCHLFLSSASRSSRFAKAFIAVYIGLFVSLNHPSLYAHNLLDTILPGLLISVRMLISAKDSRASITWVGVVTILGTFCLLTHNSAIVFVLAVAAVTIVMGSGQFVVRVITGFVIAAVPIAVWSSVRSITGQNASHSIGRAEGFFSPGEYLRQLLHGLGSLITFDRSYLPEAVVFLTMFTIGVGIYMGKDRKLLQFVSFFVLCALSGLLLIFCFTSLPNQPLNGRFIVFVPLVLVPPLFLTLSHRFQVSSIAAAIVLIGPPVYWSGQWTFIRIVYSLDQQGFPTGFVPYHASIDPSIPSETAVRSDGEWRVGVCNWWRPRQRGAKGPLG